MKIPQYDIFSGQIGRDALWVEAVEGLGEACQKMKELAKKSPGAYFVFCPMSHSVLASIDTSVTQEAEKHKPAQAGTILGR